MALSLAEWIDRIERVRATDGVDGDTISTPVLSTFVVPTPQRFCAHCGTVMTGRYQVRFCSHHCYSRERDQGAVELICPCGEPFMVQAAHYAKFLRLRGQPPRYCSRACTHRFSRTPWRMRRAG